MTNVMKRLAVLMTALIIIVSLGALSVSAAAKKGVTLNKSSVSMTVGKTVKLKASVNGYKRYTLVWSTSDKNIVAIASGGKLTAKKAGTATVTVKIKGTKYKAVCKVKVKKAVSNNTTSAVTTNMKNDKTGSAMEFVKNIEIGWNLGNTLDAIGSNGVASETSWGNPKTTESMIKAVKKAGFNTVRIPVSWGNHMDSSNNVDTAWMKRVKEVVDYAIDNDMYVILNTHHETSWLVPTPEKEKEVTKKFTALWKQIAAQFKDYDEHLIFEGMNEPRTEGSKNEWNGGTKEERDVINNLNAAFVKTVRESGGNNKTRYLMVTPYAASSSVVALKALEVPDDDRVIVSVHAYTPYNMALNRYSDVKKLDGSGKSEIDGLMKNINDIFISKGQAVILGEFGTINKSNTAAREEQAKYYVEAAEKIGVPCIWWDNGTKCSPSEGEGFGLLDRRNMKWWYDSIVDTLIDAAK